ncbi:4'-phosphopantetheinyl transferase superfamily protein [Lysinibacillus xylanilyticus]|uniref:4'-phosphopantetheinyl transferase family protein n=1 Tax=Lysinibacillus xylanilyticus TaxID=582475 RepID=UPI002B23F6FB|nr:4'-phosphopantetheinyl transferase superfamily protein [Lysinibacillus xylanilyticus]MEB2302385.1 4'-phosphopantetheinyl transferase superfamily protein [Lysinibacillus xylanilyticus]
MSEVFALNINEEVEEKIYADLFHVLSDERKVKTNKYYFEIDAKRSICAEVLVKYIVCQKLNISYSDTDILFMYNPYGKPYFDSITGYYFNISHAGNWVVCAWSEKEIGVDVEMVKDIDIAIAKHYFSESEYIELMSKEAEDRKKLLIDFWTLKESYIKYKGKGLFIPLNSISFHFEDGKVHYDCENENNVMFHMLDLNSEHKLSVCSLDPILESIRYVSLKEIWRTLCLDRVLD